jgi:phospholipid/cholesterol/gamma-HCH transport system substrate-binding protein
MSRNAKIGLFFLSVGIAGISYIMMSINTFSRQDTYVVHVMMDDASGLTTNSQVQMAGVPVGNIRSIELVDGKARVTLAISKNIELYDDATIAKQPSSLLGTSVVSINPGSQGGSALSHGDTVHTVISRGDFGGALSAAENAGAEMALILRELREELFTEDTYGGFAEIIENLRRTTETTRLLLEQNLQLLAASLNSMNEVIQQIESRSTDELERITRILESTAVIAERLEGIVTSPEDDLSRSIVAIRTSMETLNETMESLAVSAENIEDITGTVRRGEGNIGRVVYDQELYDRVVNIAEGAESIVERITGLGVQVGFAGHYRMEDEASQQEFSFRLVPLRSDRYYELGIVNTPEDYVRKTTTRTEVDGELNEPDRIYTTTETETSDRIKLNAQIAQAYGPVTIRGGLIENSGGFGLDLRPVKQLQISGEMFEFGDVDGPNLRTTGTIYPFYDPDAEYPWNWIFITGGANRVLTADRRDFFLGGGLRFSDENLRGLVGLIPIGSGP